MELIEIILKPKEREVLIEGLGRSPNTSELAMIAAMWSEHCSYKRSRYFLKRLPNKAPHLLAGVGENAGIIQVSEDLALAFKIESHNHPSAVVPYQGAATGVGGILRDIFTMGARPIALLNSLHFDLSEEKGRRLFDRVVEGIGDYGNCTGIPTVGGEVESYPWFAHNPLMNAACIGKIHPKKITMSSTAQAGDLVLYFGNKTGRDGLEGAIFASLSLTQQTRQQKSAVQVADPFMGKIILEASLLLIEKAIPSAMQDMGAAGITCSTSEIAHKSHLGIEVNLDLVPQRAPGMKPEEILLSESQERMLAAVPPHKKEEAEKILGQFPLDYAWIGKLNDSGEIEMSHQGKEVVHLPLPLLVDGCPIQEYPHLHLELRPYPTTSPLETKPAIDLLMDLFVQVPSLASKAFVYRQFDHEVGLSVLSRPGKGPTVIYDFSSHTAISLSIQSRSNWMKQDPCHGTLATLALCLRSSFAQGSYPLGLSNCQNFPSPEKEANMEAFASVMAGMKHFCETLNIPVTGGNVSFYNETENSAIPPSPVFVMVGKSSFGKEMPVSLQEPGRLYLTGSLDFQKGEIFTHYLLSQKENRDQLKVPQIDLEKEKRLGKAILGLYEKHHPRIWIREIGAGGLFKRLLENHSSHLDYLLELPSNLSWQDLLFGEGELSYLIYLSQKDLNLEGSLQHILKDFSLVSFGRIESGAGRMSLGKEKRIDLKKFSHSYQNCLDELLD